VVDNPLVMVPPVLLLPLLRLASMEAWVDLLPVNQAKPPNGPVKDHQAGGKAMKRSTADNVVTLPTTELTTPATTNGVMKANMAMRLLTLMGHIFMPVVLLYPMAFTNAPIMTL
jgi:hypothetical protein